MSSKSIKFYSFKYDFHLCNFRYYGNRSEQITAIDFNWGDIH